MACEPMVACEVFYGETSTQTFCGSNGEYTCNNCVSCQGCDSAQYGCTNNNDCASAQNFCKTNQLASSWVSVNLSAPSNYSFITPDIFNNIKQTLKNFYDYGNYGTRNPQYTNLSNYNSIEKVTVSTFNNIANNLSYNTLVSQYESFIDNSYLSDLINFINNQYKFNSDRCNKCNTSGNATTECTSCNNGGEESCNQWICTGCISCQ